MGSFGHSWAYLLFQGHDIEWCLIQKGLRWNDQSDGAFLLTAYLPVVDIFSPPWQRVRVKASPVTQALFNSLLVLRWLTFHWPSKWHLLLTPQASCHTVIPLPPWFQSPSSSPSRPNRVLHSFNLSKTLFSNGSLPMMVQISSHSSLAHESWKGQIIL